MPSVQCVPTEQKAVVQSSMLTSQSVPLKPAGHSHVYLKLSIATQLLLLRVQGLDLHGSGTEKKRNN